MKTFDDLYKRALKAAKKPRNKARASSTIHPGRAEKFQGAALGQMPGKGKRYYIVIGFHPKVIGEIASGVLQGVKGISSCKEIVPQWFTMGRDAVIVMDAKAAARANTLTEIEYAKPSALLRDDMALLHRLYDKKMTPSGRQQVLLHLIDSAGKGAMRVIPSKMEKLQNKISYWDGRAISEGADDISWGFKKQMEKGTAPHIQTAYDLADWLTDNAPELVTGWNKKEGFKHLTTSDWEKMIEWAASEMGSRYEEECEVVVADEKLVVPKGSFLYVAHGGYPVKNETLLREHLPALEKHYGKIFLVNPTSLAMGRLRGKVMKRSFERRKERGYI